MYVIQFIRNKKKWYYKQTKEVEEKIRVTDDIDKATTFKTIMAASIIASQNKGQVVKKGDV